MARNKYDIDENLESPFRLTHFQRALVYVKKYRAKMIAALLFSIIASIIGLCGPLIIRYAMGEAVPEKNLKLLLLLSGILALTVIINIVLNTIKGYITNHVGQNVIYDIRKDLFAHLQKLPFRYYDSRPHGKILVRVVQYINNVADMFSNGIINLVVELLNVLFIAAFMFLVSVRLALVVLSGLPIVILIIFIIKPAQRKAWQTVSNASSNQNAFFQESIEGVRVTQIFDRQEVNKSIAARLIERYRKVWMRAIYISQCVWASVDIISQIVFSAVYIIGIFYMVPSVSFAVVLAMGMYTHRFWQPIINIANIYNNFINTIAYLERIFDTMDEKVDIDDAPGATELPPIKGEIDFKNVVFEYEPGIRVLDNVSFKISPGESIALVGPTGSGKTTIVNIISRFYDISQGQVLIDGTDIREVTLKSLRSQMGVMLQDSFIFSGTIADNIRFGKLDATDEEIEAASKTVHAHEFIAETENGYYTEVRERGARLSQGQKQLISFSRTLLSDPKILILDEATSSIDTKTERQLQMGLMQLLKGRTSIIVAHRLSTIKHCDRIMFIENGKIVEIGSHDELIAQKGAYWRLCQAQNQL